MRLPKNIQHLSLFLIALNFNLTFNFVQCQDPVSSHHFLFNSFTNPAFSGLQNDILLTINYRNQWPGLGNAFTTYKASLSGLNFKNNFGIGLGIANDNSGNGIFSNTGIDLFYTYTIKSGINSRTVFSLQTSVYQNSIHDPGISNVPDWVNNYTPSGSVNERSFKADFSTGMAYSLYNFQLGLGIFHLYQPFNTNTGDNPTYPVKYNLTAMYDIPLRSPFKRQEQHITPFLHLELQDINKQITGGAMFTKETFTGGIFLKQIINPINSSIIILSSKLNFLNLYIVYSFDMLLSNSYITFNKFGIHEVTLGYNFEYKEKMKHKNTINCPY